MCQAMFLLGGKFSSFFNKEKDFFKKILRKVYIRLIFLIILLNCTKT
jgi:hypothetical protein